MNIELLTMNGYGQFVWTAFIFSFVACLYLYLKTKNVEKSLKHILSLKKPLFVEVVTDNKQLIFDAFQDH